MLDVKNNHYNRENGQKLFLSVSYHSRKLVVIYKSNHPVDLKLRIGAVFPHFES